MKTAIIKNDEVVFTEDKGLINTNELASYDEVLEEISYGWCDELEDGHLVKVAEGVGIVNDDTGFEIVIVL